MAARADRRERAVKGHSTRADCRELAVKGHSSRAVKRAVKVEEQMRASPKEARRACGGETWADSRAQLQVAITSATAEFELARSHLSEVQRNSVCALY
jgi:hypothetical protein